ncbi:hypothetical protein ANO11243_042270 [Dothideomycetidae sp. 11243]|nr:hypothetical protein ANO11243_042270 [fungal sp. No.11243]
MPPPAKGASLEEAQFYARHMVLTRDTFEAECTTLATLEYSPHPNIVEVVDTQHPEGVYLKRYGRLPTASTLVERLGWYVDLLAALAHLHELEIAHADLHPHNLLVDHDGHAMLCDFGTAMPFETSNFPDPNLCSPRNGFGEELNDASDRFGAASLIYWIERGKEPAFIRTASGWDLAELSTGEASLDAISHHAWQGVYDTTLAMHDDLQKLRPERQQSSWTDDPAEKEQLKERIRLWRENRQRLYGIPNAPRKDRDQIR